MKKLLFIFGPFFILNLNAQEPDQIIVPARTKVADCFPPKVRYLYPCFSQGQVILHNGNHNSASLNYNFLFGEMEFLREMDTLAIIDKKEIRSVIIAQDTFLLGNGYIRLISSGTVRLGLKEVISLKDILRKGAMGTTNRTSAMDTYNTVPLDGLCLNTDKHQENPGNFILIKIHVMAIRHFFIPIFNYFYNGQIK